MRIRNLVLSLFTLVAAVAGAQAPALTTPLPVDPKVKIGTLPNGIHYYIRQNSRPEKRAELRLVVNAGSILEDNDQRGYAHFIEHTAFNGTTNFKKNDLISYLQSIGVELKGASPLVTTNSGDALVTINRVGKGSVIFAAVADLLGEDERMVPFAAHALAHVFSDATPVTVRGDVRLINRNASGYVVTLLNNNGVFKPQQGMAAVDRSAYVTVNITMRGQQIQSATDWITDKQLPLTGDGLSLQVAPGGVSVIELKIK